MFSSNLYLQGEDEWTGCAMFRSREMLNVDVEEEIVDSRKVIASESANKTVQNHMELFAFEVMP